MATGNSQQLTDQITNIIKSKGANRSKKYEQLLVDKGVADKRALNDSIRKTVLDTERILSSQPKNIQRRTQGRGMTQAQVDRLLATEREPLAQTMEGLARQEEVGRIGMSDLMGDIENILKLDDADITTQLQELREQRGNIWDKEARDAAARASAQNAFNYDPFMSWLEEERARRAKQRTGLYTGASAITGVGAPKKRPSSATIGQSVYVPRTSTRVK